jgi:indolepyruvate ferredoxin oxidoreductase beta subunit
MKGQNIYLTGVGGQGIGMLSEVLIRAADHAGLNAKGVDTHGLAQRGGIVVSHLRIGPEIYSPLIAAGTADMVVALERCEALRAMAEMLKPGGTLVVYDTLWQPLPVRLGNADSVSIDNIHKTAETGNISVVVVQCSDLEETRMQNTAVLARLSKDQLIPGIDATHYRQAMTDLMRGNVLTANLFLFDQGC